MFEVRVRMVRVLWLVGVMLSGVSGAVAQAGAWQAPVAGVQTQTQQTPVTGTQTQAPVSGAQTQQTPVAPGQTETQQQTPVSGAQTQQTPAAPVPTPMAPGTVPAGPGAYPAYGVQTPSTATPTLPAPQPSTGQPAVAPAVPGPETPYVAYVPYGTPDEFIPVDRSGSAYIAVDSWVYPAMLRLYSMGYVDTMFLSMRPWTRRSLLHMLRETEDAVLAGDNEEAKDIVTAVLAELREETPANDDTARGLVYGTQSVYTRAMGIGGQTLRDSYHLGQTIVNDYGRPYQAGFNNVTGVSSLNEWGRFSLHLRGEYQHAPGATGYSNALAAQLSGIDEISPYAPPNQPQGTIPEGPIGAANRIRLVEATLSYHILGHEISGGKTDSWLGPTAGGAMAWTNNAENIYSFRINRVEPLHIPLVSRVLGPLRYDFFYGDLKGHTYVNHPYVHSEMFSFRPTSNFEFAFQRTIIFGGKGHEPVTLHTFLRGFFSINDTTANQKNSALDPGARYSDFSASYRLPFVRKYVTFVVDSIAHDDVTPISAPRRAAYRTGLYVAQIPGLKKLDFRLEAVTTDPKVTRSNNGQFNYYEIVQRNGYTNNGYIMGDWIGREAKGGQAWLTYHLSGNEWVQVEYLNKKTPKDFVPGGTTQNSFMVSVVKRLRKDVELNAWVQHESWKAPIYLPGAQSNTVGAVQVTWFPKLHAAGTP